MSRGRVGRVRTGIFLLAFLAACWLVCAQASEGKVKLLNGFNDEAECAMFSIAKGIKVELVREHATEGENAAKLTCPPNSRWSGFSIRGELLARWGDYDYLTFDVFNPYDTDRTVFIRIDDDQSNNSDYSTQYGRKFRLFPGGNKIKIKISRMPNQVQAWLQRRLDPNKLKLFCFWFPYSETEEMTLYVDNFALRKNPKVDLPKSMLAFAFGCEDSDFWPGFTPVTPKSQYSDAAGHGFKSTDGLAGLDDNFDRESLKNGDPLCGGGVYRPGRPLTFIVKLAPGQYRLWCAAGMTVYPKREYTVSCNGQQVFKCEAGDRFDGLDPVGRDYTNTSTVWEVLAAGKLCDEFTTEIDVKGDRVEITIEGDYASWLSGGLRAIVIHPVGDAVAEKTFADIQRQRREKFLERWKVLKPAEIPAPPELTADERTRGFILAYRHYCEPITPWFVPKAEDRLEKISIAATPGENEPAVFIVYPVAEAPKAEVKVGSLTGPAGTIPSGAVKVEYVHYRYIKGKGGLDVVPSHIVPLDHVAIEKGVPRQFWMTVKVPDDASPGKYAGTVTVATASGRASFPLEVEVYPFKLDSVADCGLIYAHVYSVPNAREDFEAGVRCLVEHNCNSSTVGGVVRLDRELFERTGKAVVNLDRLDMAMEVMKAGGMTGPVPLFDMSIQGEGGGNSYSHIGLGKGRELDTQRYFDAIVEVTRQIKERAEEKDYLPVLMYPVTELSNDPNMGPPYLEKLVKAYRKVDDIQLICSLNTPKDIVCAKILDHMMVNWGLNLTEERLAQIRADGAKLWFQNIGKSRYTEGFLMLKAEAIGRRQFTVSCAGPGSDKQGGDPYNCFLGGGNSSMFRTVAGAIPNVSLKWMSEGADDCRYGHKLLSLIREANEKGPARARAAATEAQKAYDAIMAQIQINTGGGAIETDGRCDRIGDFYDKSTYDRFRRTIAELIITVSGALGKP